VRVGVVVRVLRAFRLAGVRFGLGRVRFGLTGVCFGLGRVCFGLGGVLGRLSKGFVQGLLV
jgi:hypothetical protein